MTEPQTITEAELAEALDSFWLFVACGGQRVHGQVADPDEVASVLLATMGRIAAERSPGEPAGEPLTAAQCDRLRHLVTEHQEAVSAVRRALDLAVARARTNQDVETFDAAREALMVLEGGEEESREH